MAGQLDLKTAWPRRWAAWMRSGFFLDVGNAYSTDDTLFFDAGGELLDHGFSASELRASAGIAADLLLPFGTVRLSYAVPLNPSDGNGDATLRDRAERFQSQLRRRLLIDGLSLRRPTRVLGASGTVVAGRGQLPS